MCAREQSSFENTLRNGSKSRFVLVKDCDIQKRTALNADMVEHLKSLERELSTAELGLQHCAILPLVANLAGICSTTTAQFFSKP